jgi:hypothetical protein
MTICLFILLFVIIFILLILLCAEWKDESEPDVDLWIYGAMNSKLEWHGNSFETPKGFMGNV